VRRWFARYLAEGVEGLSDAPRPGVPPKATPGYRERLLQAARCRPRALGLAARFTSVFSVVRNLFVPPARKRPALSTHLHRLAAFARWRSAVGLVPA
jgi:hypothetical protein